MLIHIFFRIRHKVVRTLQARRPLLIPVRACRNQQRTSGKDRSTGRYATRPIFESHTPEKVAQLSGNPTVSHPLRPVIQAKDIRYIPSCPYSQRTVAH
jgi:hypothetical protein